MAVSDFRAPDVTPGEKGVTSARRRYLSLAADPRRVGALQLLILLIIVFSLWQPSAFPNYTTVVSILSSNAVPALVALGLTLPLAAGEYDLSVGYVLGTGSMLLAWLLGHTGMSVVEASAVTLAACALIGVFNGFLVVNVGINSFIGTLASGSLLQALIQTLSGGLTLANGVAPTSWIGTDAIGQITLPVICTLVLAIVLWVLHSHTPAGKKIYATGLGREAAVLSGVPTNRIRFVSFIVSATVAGFAGIVITAQVGAASPSTGPPYIIPAFAAAFLGSTQFKPGFFNSWGTIVAILLLGTLDYGLALVGVPSWVPYLSTGSVLIVALAMGRVREHGMPRFLQLRSRSRLEPSAPSSA